MAANLKDAIESVMYTGLKNMHSALPGIVISFDATLQTATILLAIKRIVQEEEVSITPLVDVPVMQPSAGGWHITFPIKAGDECLVIFSERAIDIWFASGEESPPAEERIHDISDGFAIMGVNSKPNAIPNYNPDGMELRNEANDQRITFNSNGSITIDVGSLVINSDVDVTGSLSINGIVLETHSHPQANDSDGNSQQDAGIPF